MKCKKCDSEKEINEFYSNDRTCKECRKSAAKENRIANAEHYRKYEKSRAKRPDRVAARKAYSKTEAGKAAHRRAHKRWIEKNPIKRAAHILVGNAIRKRRLIKKPCEICGNEISIAHHEDYAKPFDVRWLCSKHHEQWHRENGEGKNAH